MLQKLFIRNFAIIDELDVEFSNGFVIITGETGAGKSILVDSIELLSGERADSAQIGDKSKKCVIEGIFKIYTDELKSMFDEFELDFSNETLIRREILPDGKSRAFVNDTPVNLKNLKTLTRKLITIYSQFDHTQLLKSDYQLNILDTFSKNTTLLSEYLHHFNKYNKLKSKLNEALENQRKALVERDFILFQVDELRTLNLKANEYEQIETEFNELSHAEDIKLNFSLVSKYFDDDDAGILSLIRKSFTTLQTVTKYSDDAQELANRLESCRLELVDINRTILNKVDSIEHNEERLIELSNRLDEINKLIQKHRVKDASELLIHQAELESKQVDFERFEEEIKQLTLESASEFDLLNKLANQLHKIRTEKANELAVNFKMNLKRIGMSDAEFEIKLSKSKHVSNSGFTETEFYFSSNKGRAPEVLSKVASGGELSRIMLVANYLISKTQSLPTIIFDEIDTGISGAVANDVGNLLKEMSENIQVIAITHLPQVASKGNSHLRVFKTIKQNKTTTAIEELNEEKRIDEIAAMISGSEMSIAAKQQASTLLNQN